MFTGNENKITLTLIRHGFTNENTQGRYIGVTDSDLCDDGIRALKEKYPHAPKADYIFVSPMKRCLQSAEIIFGIRNVIVIPEFKEMNFGDFECKNYNELNGNPAYQSYIDSGGEAPFPNGESKEDFKERSIKGLYKLYDMCRKFNMKVPSAVVHGGSIMAILSYLTKEDYFSFRIKCGEGYRLNIILKDKNVDCTLTDYKKI